MNSRGEAMRQNIRENTLRYINTAAPPEYREILKPDYEPGCKRRVNTATYLASLHSPQMHLTKDTVVKIGPNHIETAAGHRIPVDAIIYATGFQTQKWLSPIQIKGMDGKDLHGIWDAAGGAEAYKGTAVSGFPNFFILYGPNVGTGQHSVIFHSECQINFICKLLQPVLAGSSKMIMVKPEAQRQDVSWVHEKLQHLVFNSGCQSWWMDPVTKRNTFIYPDPMWKYWVRTMFPRWSDFVLHRGGRKSGFFGQIFSIMVVSAGVVAFAVNSSSVEVEKVMTRAVDWSLQAANWR